ncbi:unnamed protein product [Schistosoma margrebowiei]|uniref:Uncharacterized protein n=1 Tax=Schistosoma margrebowiei TaxID=48269 RepID=A0AA84ZZA5_9TREM|nr:unnamed protein product [Schistosoma margrebowiei]
MTNIKSHAYTTKLKALNEACFKLVNNASNLPSSNDITSLLKFFQNSLYNYRIWHKSFIVLWIHYMVYFGNCTN